jgi:hypothetical protein
MSAGELSYAVSGSTTAMPSARTMLTSTRRAGLVTRRRRRAGSASVSANEPRGC